MTEMKTYEETVRDILEIPKFTSKNTLEHTREFLRRLGNPQNKYKIIHVAGSNGKGSVCAYIDSVLRAGGKKTGLFTSPHLVYMEERFVVEGKPCRRQQFVQAAAQAAQAAAEMVREGLPHPTFFEYIFGVGMLIFAWNQVEYAVVETGLGGRLDATNVVEHPLLTVITSISLEHTEILGSTIPEIAAEKAGILKQGVPLVYDASVPEASEVIEEKAKDLGCQAHPVNPKKIKILLNTGKKIAFSYDSGYDVTETSIPFGAPYQAQNAAVAIQALTCIKGLEGITEESLRQGMAEVQWKGRMQEALPDVYFDGAHNLSGIERFLEAAEQVTAESAVLLFSMVKEKDYIHAIERLLTKGNWEEVIVTRLSDSRGLDSGTLTEIFEKYAQGRERPVKITEIKEVEKAFAYGCRCRKPGQKLFCAGSLYLIGELEQIAGGMQND
ncbi:MAG: bifunctional folylpolyglutamate synthase/dihydrofolate synthase [Lachnospiraceae bacterium]|nr:bifunctional folylpolyglutamate synthase/dihydrofolate synthase [Lachnospiraceae bacterium]